MLILDIFGIFSSGDEFGEPSGCLKEEDESEGAETGPVEIGLDDLIGPLIECCPDDCDE